jgi:anti-sigma regulatory factor (Ser/Thr protein kinase)
MTAAAAATRYQRTFPGRPDQVRRVRHEVACYLAGCPAADDAILIASELAANAVVHSASRGQFFTVRCQAGPGQVRIEVEDLGGPWHPRPSADRPHGLDIIAALTGTGDSGIDGDHAGRTAWARLTW